MQAEKPTLYSIDTTREGMQIGDREDIHKYIDTILDSIDALENDESVITIILGTPDNIYNGAKQLRL